MKRDLIPCVGGSVLPPCLCQAAQGTGRSSDVKACENRLIRGSTRFFPVLVEVAI